MQRHHIITVATAVATLNTTACGELCPPWGANPECEHVDDDGAGDTDGDVPLAEHPCDILTAQTGLLLVPTGSDESPAEGWTGEPGSVMAWDALDFPAEWEWRGLPTSVLPGAAAVLEAFEGEVWLSYGTPPSDGDFAYLLVHGDGSAEPHRLAGDDQAIAASAVPVDNGSLVYSDQRGEVWPITHSLWWKVQTSAGGGVRGRVMDNTNGVIAGPAPGASDRTASWSREFKPVWGFCRHQEAADGGSDDATPEPAPELPPPPAGSFDPCPLLGSGTVAAASTYALPWIDDGSLKAVMGYSPSRWRWSPLSGGTPVPGAAARLNGLADASFDVEAGVSLPTHAWLHVGVSELPPEPGYNVTMRPVDGLRAVADSVPLDDGSRLYFVPDPYEDTPSSVRWEITGLYADVRGWALDASEVEGVYATTLIGGAYTEWGGSAWMPAAGFCVQ